MTRAKKPEFQRFKPQNTLAGKVGKGGLPDDILDEADAVIEAFTFDFIPMAYEDLVKFQSALKKLERSQAPLTEAQKDTLMIPIMMIKANAGTFHYELLAEIAETMLFTIDCIERLNSDALEILHLQTRILNQLIDKATPEKITAFGSELLAEMDCAIERYRLKYPQSEKEKGKKQE